MSKLQFEISISEISKCQASGDINLPEFKAVMLASLRRCFVFPGSWDLSKRWVFFSVCFKVQTLKFVEQDMI